MKTTIDLPDSLLAEAKATAAQRRTTLKAIFEHALRREISGAQQPGNESCFTIDEEGLPVLKTTGDASAVTSEIVYEMMDELGI